MFCISEGLVPIERAQIAVVSATQHVEHRFVVCHETKYVNIMHRKKRKCKCVRVFRVRAKEREMYL